MSPWFVSTTTCVSLPFPGLGTGAATADDTTANARTRACNRLMVRTGFVVEVGGGIRYEVPECITPRSLPPSCQHPTTETKTARTTARGGRPAPKMTETTARTTT